MGMMQWNEMRGLEWNWKRVSVKEVFERKNGMRMVGQRTRMRMRMRIRDEC